jgi:hypothetical protein
MKKRERLILWGWGAVLMGIFVIFLKHAFSN